MGDGAEAFRTAPRVARSRLAADLSGLGLRAGDTVLVHASLSRLGHVVGGAEAVIDALLDVVGAAGTVVFPTLTGSEQDGPGRPPGMDVRATPCWTGRIPETARQRPGAQRSLHPTHSVAALGAAAGAYARGHEGGASPCDEHSPYFRLIGEAGLVLLLGGVTQESNTTLHCVEELAGVPYHLQSDVTECAVVDAQGVRHGVRNRLHRWGWERDFSKIEGPLSEAGALTTGRVGCAEARLMSARRVADIVLPILRGDPLYLLSRDARESYSDSGCPR